MDILKRLRSLGDSQRAGIIALLLAVASTVIWVQLASGGPTALPGGGVTSRASNNGTGVQFVATLSNPKVVQGADGSVYLDLIVETPSRRGDGEKAPTDMIVVLDRSGSMGEGDKWPLATHAIQALLDRLDSNDRVALISFDDEARIDAPLTWARGREVERLRGIVRGLAPGASTNLGDGLIQAQRLLDEPSPPGRRRRVLLLSDGQANRGVVEPEALGGLASRLSQRGAVLSTIGMGLGFNETLMAALADLGMGSFNFLESLESLGRILVAELSDSRSLFAEGSEIRLTLPAGITLREASGYPFSMEGRTAVIRTGQLLAGSRKQFMATLAVPNDHPGQYSLGDLELSYRVDGTLLRQRIPDGRFQIACLEPARKAEALASIDRESYREAWMKNNFGSVMRQVGDLVRGGRKEEAAEALASYRQRLAEADEAVPGLRKDAAEDLKELEQRVDDAFTGRDQAVKQNRAAKSMLDASQKLQRTQEKKPQ